jgi:hypothetical protein
MKTLLGFRVTDNQVRGDVKLGYKCYASHNPIDRASLV